MNNPQLILVPIILLVSYGLEAWTVRRVAFPSELMSPMGRFSVKRGRWLDLRLPLLLVGMMACLLALDQTAPPPFIVLQLVIGFTLGYGGIAVGGCLSFLLYSYFGRPAHDASGQARIPAGVWSLSSYRAITYLPLAVGLAVLEPEPYTLGILLGVLAHMLNHITAKRSVEQAGRVSPA